MEEEMELLKARVEELDTILHLQALIFRGFSLHLNDCLEGFDPPLLRAFLLEAVKTSVKNPPENWRMRIEQMLDIITPASP